MYQPASDRWVIIEDLNVRVPRELEDDFKHDGVDAMTKYMAQPPLTEGGFFENPQTITEAQNPNLPPIITSVQEREEMLEGGKVRRYVRHELEQLPPKIEDVQYYLHGDPGLTNDAFALALAHTTPEQKQVTDQTGNPIYIQKVGVDFVPHLGAETEEARRPPERRRDHHVPRPALRRPARDVRPLELRAIHPAPHQLRDRRRGHELPMSQQYAMYRYLRLCFYNAMIELPVDEKLQNELKFIKEKNQHITHDIYGKDRADAVAAVVNGSCNDLRRGRTKSPWEGPPRRASPGVITAVIRSCWNRPRRLNTNGVGADTGRVLWAVARCPHPRRNSGATPQRCALGNYSPQQQSALLRAGVRSEQHCRPAFGLPFHRRRTCHSVPPSTL